MNHEVFVKACINGSRNKQDHPALPITPSELARDSANVMAAGAAAVHIHPRLANGSETLDPEACAAAISAIRQACPGLPVGLSTGLWIEKDHRQRMEAIRSWTVLPEFASVNFSEEGTAELCDLLLEREVGVEAGIWTTADARLLGDMGLAPHCLRILVEVQDVDPAAAVEHAALIDEVLDRCCKGVPRLHHGEGIATWSVLAAALQRGHDIRIGLEDTTQFADGSQASDNKQLVEVAMRMPLEFLSKPLKSPGSE